MFLGFDAVTWSLVAGSLVVAGLLYVRDRKQGQAEWDPRPPSSAERIVAGVWLVAFLSVVTNYYANWRLFGGYDNWLVVALWFGFLVLMARLPGVKRR